MVTLITKNTTLFKPDPASPFYYETEHTLDSLFTWAEKKEWIGLDTETTGLEFWECKLLTVQFGDWDNQFVIDLMTIPVSELIPLFISKKFILQNAKFDLQWFWSVGIQIPNEIYDTFLAETVLLGGLFGRRGLDVLAWNYCTYKLDKSVRGTAAFLGLTSKTIKYAADDVKCLERIKIQQEEKAKLARLTVVTQLENEFVVLCAEAEYYGLALDKEKWLKVAISKEAELKSMEEALDMMVLAEPKLRNFVRKYVQVSMFGFESRTVTIDYLSPQQIVKVINALGFPITSSEEETLSEINHPFAEKLLEYRSQAKFVGTYGKSFLKHIRPDGTVTTNYTQIVATGRMSSKEPNLQNIPKEDDYRNPFYAEGEYLICADYGQIELVLTIEDSKEDAWVEAQNNGYDLHSINGKMTFDKQWEKGTLPDCEFVLTKNKCKCPDHKKMRDTTKTVTYASLYGAMADKIASTLKVTRSQGAAILARYYAALPKLKKWMDDITDYALAHRKIVTFMPFRRVRYFEENETASSISRKSINTRIQGQWPWLNFVNCLGS
jgi:DNA polymerase-1